MPAHWETALNRDQTVDGQLVVDIPPGVDVGQALASVQNATVWEGEGYWVSIGVGGDARPKYPELAENRIAQVVDTAARQKDMSPEEQEDYQHRLTKKLREYLRQRGRTFTELTYAVRAETASVPIQFATALDMARGEQTFGRVVQRIMVRLYHDPSGNRPRHR